MKLTGTGSSLKSLLVLLCLGIQYGLLDAKAIKKSKHGVQKSGNKKNNAPKSNFCVNHSYCVKYSDWDCASEWVQLNCPRMCRLCEYEGPNILKLPAVLYYKKGNKKHGISGKTKPHKGKHSSKTKLVEKRDEGDRRDVVFLSKPYGDTPTEAPSKLQTTSYPLFDYQSNHRNWLFLFPDQHPVNMQYVDKGKAADPNLQPTGQQQAGATQDAAGAPVAGDGAAAPTIGPVTPAVAQPTEPAFIQPAATAAAQPVAPTGAQPVSPAAAAPVAPAAAQPVGPAVAAPAAPVAPAAVAPAVPQVGEAAAAPVASQQPVAAEPAAAVTQPLASAQTTFTNQTQVTAPGTGNQTIELLNQTVTLAINETQQPSVEMGAVGFQPTVGNITETNQTVMAGVYQPNAQGYGTVNNSSNQTVATGNITSQNQSQLLEEPQTFYIQQPNSSKTYSQETGQQSLVNASELHHDDISTQESLNTSSPRASPLPSSFQMPAEESKDQTYSQQTGPQSFVQASQLHHDKMSSEESKGQTYSQQTGPQSFVQASQVHNDKMSSEESRGQTYSQQIGPQSLVQALQLHHDKVSTQESDTSSSFQMSSEGVKSEHRLHVDNTDASTEVQGNFNPNGASVSLSGPGTMDLTTTGQSFTQDVTADSDGAAQTPWTCCNKNVKPPKDCKPCPKLPKAPPMPYVFNIYCDDVYKDCAYGYSNCNDTWWEINCPKTCGLCKAKDKVNVPTTKQVLPTEVKDLENTELESDLVAPVPGDKPLVAKYTLRVKPKLVNGVPQMQEIRIMPPNKASGFVKPLMVLKQNITKPMIENIEIDVPKKGAKFSRKPSVEVIEGDHKEMLQVHRGQALVEDPVQKSEIKPEEIKEATPTNKTEDSTVQGAQSKTEQNKAAENTTEQTESSSTTTTEQDSANETSTAKTPSSSTAEPAAQSDSSQSDNQSQSSFTAPSAQTAAYSTTETCTDDSRCATFIETQCGDPWLKANCKSKCKLC